MACVANKHIEDWHSISQYVGKEVFLVVGGEDEETGDIGVFETWGDLLEQLKTLTPTTDAETRVFHGILTLGEFIPSSFHGKSVFIICIDPYEDARGNIIESTGGCPADLAEEVSDIMKIGGPLSDMKIDIDDIYILYGYQLDTCLSINDEALDEEVIATCREIADEIEIARIIVENV
jgi:hypothetical protein